jgi:hypothetical protein
MISLFVSSYVPLSDHFGTFNKPENSISLWVEKSKKLGKRGVKSWKILNTPH